MSEAIIESLQNRYCELQNRTHRKANGQFFTPRWIAKGLAEVLDKPLITNSLAPER